MLLYLWSCFDAAGYKSFWKNAINLDEVSYAYIPICFAQQRSSSDGDIGWTFDKGCINDVVDDEFLADVLNALFTQGAIQGRFSELDKCIIVTLLEASDAPLFE